MSFFETEEYLQRYIIAVHSLFKKNESKYLELFKHHISTKVPKIENVNGKDVKRVFPFRIEIVSSENDLPTENKKVTTNIRLINTKKDNDNVKVEVIVKIGDAARFTSTFSVVFDKDGAKTHPLKVKGGYSEFLSHQYKEKELHHALVRQIVQFVENAMLQGTNEGQGEVNSEMDYFLEDLLYKSRMNFLLDEKRLIEAEELFLKHQNGGFQ